MLRPWGYCYFRTPYMISIDNLQQDLELIICSRLVLRYHLA